MDLGLKSLFNSIKKYKFLISFASILLYSLAYLYQVVKLYIWNIPLGAFNDIKINYLFIAIIGILYYVSVTYLHIYFQFIFSRYIPIYKGFVFLKKNLNKNFKIDKRLLPDKKYKEYKEYKECKNLYDNMVGIKNKLENDINREKTYTVKCIFRLILLSILCFFPFFALYSVFMLEIDILPMLFYYVLIIFIIIIFEYKSSDKLIRKDISEIKKQYKKCKKSPYTYILACEKIYDKLAPNEKKERDKKYSDHLSIFIIALASAVIVFFADVLFLLSPGKNYWIYTDESGDNYASVIESNDDLILKRAVIKDENIIIFINDQIRIKATEKNLKYLSFDSVTIERENN